MARSLCRSKQSYRPALYPSHASPQASRLTWLSLSAPSPTNIPAFLDSLGCLAGLRHLSIGGVFEEGCITLFNPHVRGMPSLHVLLPRIATAGCSVVPLVCQQWPPCCWQPQAGMQCTTVRSKRALIL